MSLRAPFGCLSCHSQCAQGCSGPTNQNCTGTSRKCVAYEYREACIPDCPINTIGDPQLGTCVACHAECLGGCTGPRATDCLACANVKDGYQCSARCSALKYPDENGVCQPCHSECVDVCFGPQATQCCAASGTTNDLGEYTCCETGSCAPNCRHVIVDVECLGACPVGMIADSATDSCQPCHPECAGGCTGLDDSDCVQCKNFKLDGYCVQQCPDLPDIYVDHSTRQCVVGELRYYRLP
jgi:hypothetical protein